MDKAEASTSSAKPPALPNRKRPADTEASDPSKKVAKPGGEEAQVAAPASSPEDVRCSDGFGIAAFLIQNIQAPLVDPKNYFIQINTVGMNHYYSTLRTSILSALYRGFESIPANTISDDHFRLVCRFLTKSRIDHVYFAVSCGRSSNYILKFRDFPIPKALADVINGIGAITVRKGALTFIPEPEADPADVTQRLSTLVSHDMLTSFRNLIQEAHNKSVIRVDYIRYITAGTFWWMLSPRKFPAIDNVATNSDTSIVVSIFKEWTPADVLIAAIVERGYNGIPECCTTYIWRSDVLFNLISLRHSFNLEA